MENEVEIWKPIPNYEDYQVSNLGRVKSFRRGNNIVLKHGTTKYGYHVVNLHNKEVRKTHNVHQLVAMAFLGHMPDGYKKVVDHINNIKSDNRLSNLQLISSRENTNKDKTGGTSKYVGVSFDKNSNKWKAAIRYKGETIRLSVFSDELDAHNAYQKALSEINQGLDLNVLYPKRIKSSIYKSIHFNKNKKKWVAVHKGKYLGYFPTESDANESVQNYIEKLKLNSIFE